MKYGIIALAFLAFLASVSFADLPTSVDFSDGKPDNWKTSIGFWEVEDGVLVGREIPADKHAAASRFFVPLTDGDVSFRMKLNDAAAVSFGFDPAKGQLKKKGHLYSVFVTKKEVRLIKHNDKSDPTSKNVRIDTKKGPVDPNNWVNVSLKLDGETVKATVGEYVLEGSDPEFSVKKPGVVFRVSKGSAMFDDVVVAPRN